MPQIAGHKVGPLGYGIMGFTPLVPSDTQPTNEQAFAAMRAALDAGCNFWNGGQFYGTPQRNSLTLLNEYFSKYPEDASKVVLSIKGALSLFTGIDASDAGVKRSIDECIAMLPKSVKKIDIFECARVDPKVPLVESLKALRDCVAAGKIGAISLSEVSAATIHKAAEILGAENVAFVEVELSMFSPDVLTNGVAKACAQHNIPLVAYSPISRGMLSGQIKSLDDLPKDDWRRQTPRFSPKNFPLNMKLVDQVCALAANKGCTPAQLAIAWVMALQKRPDMPTIIPIPGASKDSRVRENAQSATVELTDAEMAEIDSTLSQFSVAGKRYGEGHPIEG